jgi:hypothetical protein
MLAMLAACGDDDDVQASVASGGTAGTGAAASGGSATTGGGPGSGSGGMAGGASASEGQQIFRHDTFGDEQFWTDELRMHEVIPTVPPTTALEVGLKVDADAVPAEVLASADLTDPATTVALIGLDAVLGIKGEVDDSGMLTRVGVTCALCHSTVDNSVMTGIGKRIDGPANRDLNPGAIIALSPALTEDQKEVLNSWGAGFYDPRWNIDEINHPVLIPPIYGLQGVAAETYTGDGPISYWNNYVGVTQMGAQGSFEDERIGVSVMQTPDLITPKLPALMAYQLTLMAPAPPADSFNAEAAGRGEALFEGKAMCSTCHSGPNFTDVAERLHDPEEVGQEPMTAQRSATKQYRTTPLRALFDHAPYFHDGSAESLMAVVEHYDELMTLELTTDEMTDLVEYLKSL